VPPLQVVDGAEAIMLAGSAAAATATPVSAVPLFGLVMVRVSVEACAVVIEVGEKAAATVGALIDGGRLVKLTGKDVSVTSYHCPLEVVASQLLLKGQLLKA